MIRVIKSLLRLLLRLLYRVDVRGLENYWQAGERVLIVANHSSLLDGALLYAWLPETPTFAINTQIASRPLFRPFLRFVDLFMMDATSPLSVKSMIHFIRGNRKAVIFPEGRITTTGIPMKVYEGPGLVADKADAAILAVSIEGAQYSPFSYLRGRARIEWFPRISMIVLPPERLRLDPDLRGHVRRKSAGVAMQRLMLRLCFLAYDYRRTVLSALVNAARRHGFDQCVLEDTERRPLNYRQLLARIAILAGAIERDSRHGQHVGIMLPNVAAAPILFFALQYLGRVPAMLNFTAGTQAVLSACESGSVEVLYTSRKFVETARLATMVDELRNGLRIIYLEDVRPRVSAIHKIHGVMISILCRWREPASLSSVNPDSPAVILFTSGSEGAPKGVVLSHSNLLANYAQVRCLIDFRPTDTLFSCLPLFHSFGLNAGLLMPLLGGSRVFLYPTPLHYRLIPELIYELGASILFGTNTFFRGYARYAHAYDLHTLRYTVAGAEKLGDDTQRLWMEKFGIRILQGYGVTEASPVISVNTPVSGKLGSVGQLLPGMECDLEPIPGVAGGRLVVNGPNVMLGYLLHGGAGRIQPPASDRGPGWYDTGDIAALDRDGFISILGRAKRFAKLGGEMVSLTAVEELALRIWPDYHHAAVCVPDERKGEKIVLMTDHVSASRREIQDAARTLRYSELYVPRKILPIESMPVLGTGKTDYVRLEQLARAGEKSDPERLEDLSGLVGEEEQD
ncbi:MAG: AMP-binding protein [Gammaproteobacteria bacterium]|nr:AMP-binding protein [Gammaproteobacteria bacterium]